MFNTITMFLIAAILCVECGECILIILSFEFEFRREIL
jgi:hypothetical protein